MGETKGKVALLGGSGLAGRALIKEALYQGYTLRALAREKTDIPVVHSRLEVIEGSAADGESIAELLKGCSAVISTLGPSDKGKKHRDSYICSTATGHLIEHMSAAAITRYIFLSSASLVIPGDKRTNLFGLLTKYVGPLMLRDVVRDKKREYRLVAASDLNWTMVRCSSIREGDFQQSVQAHINKVPGGRVRTAELARFLVELLADTRFEKQSVFVASSGK